MKKIYSYLLLLLPYWASAQVATTPAFVVHDQPVTITYDATKGTSALQGATKIYMHAGVITSASTSDSDWKYVKGNWGKDDGVGLMTKVAGKTDVWEITLSSPRAYFSVPSGETIEKIGMVFRNEDGSKTGKSDQNEDIFVQVYEGFAVSITEPAESTILASAGELISLKATASAAATFTIYSNNEVVYTQANATSISYTHSFSGANARDILKVSATDGSSVATDQLEIIRREVSPTATMPAALQQGMTALSNTEAGFVLYAPLKSSVYLVGSFTNWMVDPAYLMNRDGDLFWLTVPNLDPASVHTYYYLVDQTITVADPYSELVLDKDNDKYLTDDRYPGLIPFPTQAQTDRLSAFRLDEPEYQWQTTAYVRPKKEDLIIYELLVRDFSAMESFQGVIDKLDYLDSLHVTAIQLMPVMEFNGNDSWGYNPTFMTALDKWYGTKTKLKELVDKAHGRGIAVILDIALNHQDFPNPFLKMWSSGSTAAANNPFFNATPTHPYNVFTDMNHADAATQGYVDRVNRYWLEEYKIDGYRFDLSKGFTQNVSTDDASFSAYDAERVSILKRMANKVWEVDPKAYVILEHFADNTEETELAEAGMMLWGNLNHAYSEAAMGWKLTSSESDFGWLSYKSRNWTQPNVVGYMESHDEERMMYRLLQYGNSQGSYSTKNLATALDRVKLAAAFFIPVPGPKMIWQFGELGYDISIDQNGRVGKKPIKWEYLEEPARQELYRTFSALNYLKTTYDVFETKDFQMPGTGTIRTLKLNSPEMNVVVVGNFGLSAQKASVSFQHEGWWYSYFGKDSLQSSSTAATIDLNPGEFKLFFDKPIFYRGKSKPLGLDDSIFARQIAIYPNPSEGILWVKTPPVYAGAIEYKVMDAAGRMLFGGSLQPNTSADKQVSLTDLRAGLYFLEIKHGNQMAVKRFIKR